MIYQVYPRSFADSNGDGMGDLEGIRSRLPYLKDLGVDAVWLSPFYASPQADAGYDVADYRAIDPMFGGLHDADAVIREAHALDLRIIVDLVPNHCSDQHEWFKQALREGPGTPLRERFHFRPGRGDGGAEPPNDWESIFGGPAWTRVADGEWYLHLFAPEQPDFNWEHPAVQDEFRSILRFWLDLGADGFRIDVAHGLVKAPACPTSAAANSSSCSATRCCPSSTRTASTRSTAPGAGSSTSTRATASASPRPGRPAPTGRPCTCGPTSCTRPSTSTT